MTVRLSNFTTKNDGWDQPPVCVVCAENTHNTVPYDMRGSRISRGRVVFSIFLFSTLCCETHLTH